jgi:hypothetical protein
MGCFHSLGHSSGRLLHLDQYRIQPVWGRDIGTRLPRVSFHSRAPWYSDTNVFGSKEIREDGLWLTYRI